MKIIKNRHFKVFYFIFFSAFLFSVNILSTEDALSLYKAGEKAKYERNYSRAIEKFRASLEKNPNYSLPMISLAECFFKTNEYDEALKYVKLAEKYDKSNINLYSLEGRIQIGLGNLDMARQAFSRVLTVQPNNLEARYGMAELDIAVGERRAAAKRYIETLKLSPDNQRALLALALIYENLGDKKISQNYLELALKYHSNDPDVHLTAGKYFLMMGNLKSAKIHLETAVSLAPYSLSAKLLLSQVYIIDKEYENAEKQINTVIKIDRRNKLAWYLQGIVNKEKGNIEKAFNSFFTELNFSPEDEASRISLENLVLAKTKTNDPVRKRLSFYHYKRGKMFEAQNYLDTAKEEYRRSLMLNPESKENRLAYAGIFKSYGYPIKYLNELKVIKKLKLSDAAILDEIEIYSGINENSVSYKWGVNQYSLNRDKYSFCLFIVPSEESGNGYIHPFFTKDYLDYFRSYLLEYSNININYYGTVDSFESAFRSARKRKVDFFIILQYDESERSFFTDTSVYITRTGSKLGYFKEYRTGNDRIRDAVVSLTNKIYEFMPLKGKLIKREFNDGLIDLGRINGVKKNDELLIIKNSRLSFDTEKIGFLYREDDILGTFKITGTDETVSEGTIKTKGFFDLINPGDEVIYKQEKKKTPKERKAKSKNLLQRIFKL
ncbi:MAG: hypothetical protein DRP58_00500 [Spirochaetes bacterium]|nr:MAG: hypothetical protein DRP58_00500 [Spirochaetota bacterium]